jgi:hypothetical protein
MTTVVMTTLFIASVETPQRNPAGSLSGGNSASMVSYRTPEKQQVLSTLPAFDLFQNQRVAEKTRMSPGLTARFDAPYHRKFEKNRKCQTLPL